MSTFFASQAEKILRKLKMASTTASSSSGL